MITVAIVDHTTGGRLDPADLARYAGAIQRQVTEHLCPAWGVDAHVCFVPEEVQAERGIAWYSEEWIIALLDHPDQAGALGYHDIGPNGLPCGKVFPFLAPHDLSVTLSHEVLELLVDPFCAGIMQTFDGRLAALEICDPCEAQGYEIDGVRVSNFCLPSWFTDAARAPDHAFDQMIKLDKPLEVAPGGYAQFFDAKKGWQMVTHAERGPSAYRQAVKAFGAGRGTRRERRR